MSKKRKAEKIRKRKEKYIKEVIDPAPYIQKALEESRKLGDPSDIFKWWYYQNDFEFMSNTGNDVLAEYCPTGIVLVKVDIGFGYWEDACKIYVNWDDFWEEIVSDNDDVMMDIYEEYPEVVKKRWVRDDMTSDEWYDSLFL